MSRNHCCNLDGEDYISFDTCLEAEVKAEMAPCLNVEYNKTYKFMPMDKVLKRPRRGKDKACKDLSEGCG
jgi:hypothetical protein